MGKGRERIGGGMREWKWRSESRGGVDRGMEKGWKVWGGEGQEEEGDGKGWKRRGRGRKEDM